MSDVHCHLLLLLVSSLSYYSFTWVPFDHFRVLVDDVGDILRHLFCKLFQASTTNFFCDLDQTPARCEGQGNPDAHHYSLGLEKNNSKTEMGVVDGGGGQNEPRGCEREGISHGFNAPS